LVKVGNIDPKVNISWLRGHELGFSKSKYMIINLDLIINICI
jgi:hypothetical protein